MIGVLPALWRARRQGETGKECVCVVYVLLTTLLSWCFIWSMLYWAEQHSHSVQALWVFLIQGNGDRCWKGWAPKQMWGTSSVEGEQESETWMSGICLCLNHSCLYQLTHHSLKFTCSLPPFALLLCRWSTSGRAKILPVRESAVKRTSDSTSFHSCLSFCNNKTSVGVGEKHFYFAVWVTFLKRATEEVWGRKSSTSLEILMFSESKYKLFSLLHMSFRKTPEMSSKTYTVSFYHLHRVQQDRWLSKIPYISVLGFVVLFCPLPSPLYRHRFSHGVKWPECQIGRLKMQYIPKKQKDSKLQNFLVSCSYSEQAVGRYLLHIACARIV